MHDPDFSLAYILCVLKCVSQHPFRGCPSDQFYALYNTIDYDMLNPTIFSFGIFTNKDRVDVIIWGFVAGDGYAGTDVGKEVESTAKGEVERDMAFSYRSLLWDQSHFL